MKILEVIDLDKIFGGFKKPEKPANDSISVLQPLAPPLTKRQDFHAGHNGVDLAAGSDKKIYAPEDGIANVGYEEGGAGNYVTIKAGNRLHKLFHMSRVLVKPNTPVRQGQPVGYVGSTGHSTGNHLHWEVWINNKPVDPMQFVK